MWHHHHFYKTLNSASEKIVRCPLEAAQSNASSATFINELDQCPSKHRHIITNTAHTTTYPPINALSQSPPGQSACISFKSRSQHVRYSEQVVPLSSSQPNYCSHRNIGAPPSRPWAHMTLPETPLASNRTSLNPRKPHQWSFTITTPSHSIAS